MSNRQYIEAEYEECVLGRNFLFLLCLRMSSRWIL